MVAARGAAVEAGGGRAHILPYANNKQQSTKNKQHKKTYIKKYKSHYYPPVANIFVAIISISFIFSSQRNI